MGQTWDNHYVTACKALEIGQRQGTLLRAAVRAWHNTLLIEVSILNGSAQHTHLYVFSSQLKG